MSALRGILISRDKQGNIKSEVSRLSHRELNARLNTWNTEVYVSLGKDGSCYFSVTRNDKQIFGQRIEKE